MVLAVSPPRASDVTSPDEDEETSKLPVVMVSVVPSSKTARTVCSDRTACSACSDRTPPSLPRSSGRDGVFASSGSGIPSSQMMPARQHDAVGLLAFNEDIHVYRTPATKAGRVRTLYHELDGLKSTGGTDWHKALEHVQVQLRKKSLLVVISDFYTDPDNLANVLLGLTARGHDLLLVHVLDPGERHVRLKSAATLRDAETGEVMEVSPDELAADYPDRLRNHVDALRKLTLSMGGHYLQVDTDQPLDRTLAGYLRFRARHP